MASAGPLLLSDVTCQIYKPAEAKQESASIQDTKDREGKKESKRSGERSEKASQAEI